MAKTKTPMSTRRDPLIDIMDVMSDHLKGQLTKTENHVVEILIKYGLMEWDIDETNDDESILRIKEKQ